MFYWLCSNVDLQSIQGAIPMKKTICANTRANECAHSLLNMQN